MHDQEPTFHGIEMIGVIATVLFGQLEATVEQLDTMREVEATGRAHVLDEETFDRIEVLYTEVQNDADLYIEQLRRWRAAGLASTEAEEVAVLEQQVKRLREAAKELVAIGARLRMQLS